jgi:hypothetical protein
MTHEDEDIKRLLTEAVPRLTQPADRVGEVAARVRRRRQRMVGGSALAVAAVVALGVGGAQLIAGTQAPPHRNSSDSSGQRHWTSCADTAPKTATPGFGVTAQEAAALPHLDSDFIPHTVVICGQETQRRADGGQDLVLTERRGDDVAALVAALRLPDEPRVGPCWDTMPGAPWLALVDAGGRWTRPGIPLDGCGDVRPEVRAALDALPLVTVATRPIREIESAEAAAAGCSQNWKDVLRTETAGNDARPGTLPKPFPSGQQVRLCVYQVPGSDPGTGDFVHGTVLPTNRRTAVDHLLRAAGPAEPCRTHAGRFALLQPVTDGGPTTYVELDGCHRIMSGAGPGGPVIAQGDAALAGLLDQP